jgi:serine/threonine protein kinase
MSQRTIARARTLSSINWLVDNRFKLGRRLGAGTCASVFKAEDLMTGNIVAVKVQERESLESHSSLEQEGFVMVLLANKHVPTVYDIVKDDKYCYLVEEYCAGGDLLQLVQEFKRLSEPLSCKYFRQVCETVRFTHQGGYVHRDLKLENIMLDRSGENVLLGDWGFATQWKRDSKLQRSTGSFHYAPPEIWRGLAYTGPEVDVWALGVCLYVLATGKFPFFGRTHQIIARRVLTPRSYARPAHLSTSFMDLMDRMLDMDPLVRITLDEVLEHPWMCQQELSVATTSSSPMEGITTDSAVGTGVDVGVGPTRQQRMQSLPTLGALPTVRTAAPPSPLRTATSSAASAAPPSHASSGSAATRAAASTEAAAAAKTPLPASSLGGRQRRERADSRTLCIEQLRRPAVSQPAAASTSDAGHTAPMEETGVEVDEHSSDGRRSGIWKSVLKDFPRFRRNKHRHKKQSPLSREQSHNHKKAKLPGDGTPLQQPTLSMLSATDTDRSVSI